MTIGADGGRRARRLRATRDGRESAKDGPAGMHEPDWAPLEGALPLEQRAEFMWMGWAIRPDGPPIARYKHAVTRRYLNLDAEGAAYRYVAAPEPAWCGSYVRVALSRAIERALDGASASM